LPILFWLAGHGGNGHPLSRELRDQERILAVEGGHSAEGSQETILDGGSLVETWGEGNLDYTSVSLSEDGGSEDR